MRKLKYTMWAAMRRGHFVMKPTETMGKKPYLYGTEVVTDGYADPTPDCDRIPVRVTITPIRSRKKKAK